MVQLAPIYERLSLPILRAPVEKVSGANPARILIVEDDYFVALDLEHRLMERGFDVIGIAASAEEAFQLAAARKPELAVVDIRLAGPRDGVEVAVELLTEMGVASVFATAHADEHTRKRAERARPLGFVQKPYSSEVLIRAVEGALARIRK